MPLPLGYSEVKSADLEIPPDVRHLGDKFAKLLEKERQVSTRSSLCWCLWGSEIKDTWPPCHHSNSKIGVSTDSMPSLVILGKKKQSVSECVRMLKVCPLLWWLEEELDGGGKGNGVENPAPTAIRSQIGRRDNERMNISLFILIKSLWNQPQTPWYRLHDKQQPEKDRFFLIKLIIKNCMW